MNQKFGFEETGLKGAFVINPFVAEDNRGAFIKDFNEDLFALNGIKHNLKEVFYTVSYKGVIRAVHFQLVRQQAKLVRCIKGSIYDVIVDLRKNSPTFGKWEGFYLNDKNYKEIYVPQYFGHGYLVLEDSIVSYKCAENFYPEGDSGIAYNDPELNIKWPYELIGGKSKLIMSFKDLNLMSFFEYKKL